MINKSTELIKSRMLAASPFTSYADFDVEMDCIRIQLRDCSTTEDRISEHVTLVYDNYPKINQPQLVGINIKGLHELGLSLSGVYMVADLLDKIVSRLPAEEAREVRRYVGDLQPKIDEMQVDIPDTVMA